MNKPIDLNQCLNNKCVGKCNKRKRDEITENGICNIIESEIDNLPIRCVGEWAYEKICRLTKYFGIFTVGMKNKWKNINYIEICCGPGRCVARNSAQEMDGTALAILNHPAIKYLKKAIFIDIDRTVIDTLNSRIKMCGKEDIATALRGDYKYTSSIDFQLGDLDTNSLNLLLIDPTDCSVPFSTIEHLSGKYKNLDIIYNVAIGTDVSRNIRNSVLYEKYVNSKNKYQAFLGDENYFSNQHVIAAAKQHDIKALRISFINTLRESLKRIGYHFVDMKSVLHYYYLLFASKHEKGLEFWEKANKIDPKQQYMLF